MRPRQATDRLHAAARDILDRPVIQASTRLRSRSGQVVATKGGHTRDGASWGLDGRPECLRTAAEESCRRLDVDAIDVYQHHRPDPGVPYEDSIGARVALARMLAESPVVIPIPGASRRESVRDSAAAPAVELADDDLAMPDTGG